MINKGCSCPCEERGGEAMSSRIVAGVMKCGERVIPAGTGSKTKTKICGAPRSAKKKRERKVVL